MTGLSRLLLTLLADVQITGAERLPEKGPVILAGNHAAVLEAVMMAAYTPGIVEFIGNGDIPFDPKYAFITRGYGLIPINRGNLDRKGLQMALDILTQGGLLGIFPEGGVWDPEHMQAQIGVAWLSYKAQAPVLPVGFGGTRGGLVKAFELKRPTLTMNVGTLISPVQFTNDKISAKANLEAASQHILDEIRALIPETELKQTKRRINETFKLEVAAFSHKGEIALPDKHQLSHGAAYARLLYNPTMLDVLFRNLRLPLKPIKFMESNTNLDPLLKAWQAILDYTRENPGFFTYRFGVEEGLSVTRALQELIDLGQWAKTQGYRIILNPIRHYRNRNTGAKVVEYGGCFPASMR